MGMNLGPTLGSQDDDEFGGGGYGSYGGRGDDYD